MARWVNILVWCVLSIWVSTRGVKSDTICDLEIADTLHKLLNPQESDSIQVQALRRELFRKIQEAEELAELEDDTNYKRNMASLAAWNNLPESKRNIAALARAGYLKNTDLDSANDDANYKRSIAILAKNGQLPMVLEEQKRGIEALARNGDLHPRRDYQDKRNLMRNYSYENFGKRSLSSIVRSRQVPYPLKRNIAALARQSLLPENYPKAVDRKKRDVDYYDENPVPVYQGNGVTDYDDQEQDGGGLYQYPVGEKRFLGSVARSGWFRPSTGYTSRFVSPEKRHVGSLARLGWLPTYRNVRRFNRSGRSTLVDADTCREAAANGKTENDTNSKISQVSLSDNKRYLLQPAVDNIILRKMFMHPRSH